MSLCLCRLRKLGLIIENISLLALIKTFSVFPQLHRNASESWGELKMSVFTVISSFVKHAQVFLQLNSTTENVFYQITVKISKTKVAFLY